jgi:DNA polymerase-4
MMTTWVLHVDLDQFIAAVEVLRRPELRGRPVVVGGDGDPSKRGVVATASYEAREYGVGSGLPLRTAAKRLPPDAVFLPVDRAAYEAVSERVMDALRACGAVVEVMGWDEAFVGVGTDDPEGFARSLQESVLAETELSCSVGIGENKLQAKIATGFGKPAGVFRLTPANWYEVLGARPTDALWGIGAKTSKKLAGLGIVTVSDLAAAAPDELAAVFGPMTGPWLVMLGRGIGDRDVDPSPYVAKGHGREETFQENVASWDSVRDQVIRIAELLAVDLAGAEYDGRPVARVVVKVRYAPFITETHGVALNAMTLTEAALAALDRFTGRRAVRLLGVRAEFGDLQRAGHGDLVERRVGGQRLALAGRRETAALIQLVRVLVDLGDPQVQGGRACLALGPLRDLRDQRLADATAPGPWVHPHRHQFGGARNRQVTAGQPGRLGAADFRQVGEERGTSRGPGPPVLLGERRRLGVGRAERVRRVSQRREPDVTQRLPLLGGDRSHEDHDHHRPR